MLRIKIIGVVAIVIFLMTVDLGFAHYDNYGCKGEIVSADTEYSGVKIILRIPTKDVGTRCRYSLVREIVNTGDWNYVFYNRYFDYYDAYDSDSYHHYFKVFDRHAPNRELQYYLESDYQVIDSKYVDDDCCFPGCGAGADTAAQLSIELLLIVFGLTFFAVRRKV